MYYIESKIFLALLSSPKTWLMLLVFSPIFIFNFLLLCRIPNDFAIRQVCYFKVVIFQINFSIMSTYHYQRVDNHMPHDSVAILTLGFPFRFGFCWIFYIQGQCCKWCARFALIWGFPFQYHGQIISCCLLQHTETCPCTSRPSISRSFGASSSPPRPYIHSLLSKGRLCLWYNWCVCLIVCGHYSKSYEWIMLQCCGTLKNWLNFDLGRVR